MNGKDLTLIGLAADVSGAVLLARGFIMKSLSRVFYETRTYFDGNRFLLRSALFQRAEAWGGASLLFVGFALQMVANLDLAPDTRQVLGGWTGLLTLVFMSALVYFACARVAYEVAKRQFLAYMFRRYKGARPFVAPENAEKRAEMLATGLLYDLKPKLRETDAQFADRLNDYFESVGPRFRGKVVAPRDYRFDDPPSHDT